MQRLDIPVRAPTGPAWVLMALSFILAGEFVWEARKDTTATFFHIPLADVELYSVAVCFGLASLVGLLWLLSLYLRPGRLLIDPEAGRMVRTRRHYVKEQRIEAPFAEYEARLQFYSERDQARGAFRRVELKAPGLHEVLLLSDVQDGKPLTEALAAVAPQLKSFKVEFKSAPVKPPTAT